MLVVSRCVLCLAGGPVVCARCHAGLRPAPAMPPPLLVDRCSALLHYHSSGLLVPAFKNRGRRDLVTWLAAGMAALVEVPPAVVTWAPTTPGRRRTRGYDQAELLAAAVARRLGVPCASLLRRSAGPAQAGRTASGRAAHPGFHCIGAPNHAVLIVDDVVTTGATLTAAARALRAAGAAEVHALVAARAPAPRARERSGTAVGSGLR